MRTKIQRMLTRSVSTLMLFTAVPLAYSNMNMIAIDNTLKTTQASVDDKSRLKDLLANYENFQANFTQTITDSNGDELQTASGTILLVKPQKLRWEVTFPEEALLIADGQTVFSIDPFLEQVTLLEQDDLTNNNPLMLLTTNDESQWERVDVVFNNGYFVVNSKDDNAMIVSVTLKFDDNASLTRLISEDRQQQTNTISFTLVEQNIVLPNDIFTYDVKPSWVIDDQRTIAQ
ncbi:outer membrane lipoprotein chaperone LolA [Glaciecola petra]|uniref:Outer-membrane lipoprotein carrier protein n=1 Tax=Glaciecola petra TaxID=3075602 RepID=A0ABU2ZPE1_9ALTE|nr:outer membrane lipoprotein chaperone LolA [Aestuariibacter sp. P117]MDT0594275.1 outer membrane lipoprotein chaperone LolA [Aestuariibacter sp. P117]